MIMAVMSFGTSAASPLCRAKNRLCLGGLSVSDVPNLMSTGFPIPLPKEKNKINKTLLSFPLSHLHCMKSSRWEEAIAWPS